MSNYGIIALDTVNKTDLTKILKEFPAESLYTVPLMREKIEHRVVLSPPVSGENNDKLIIFFIYVRGSQYVYKSLFPEDITLRTAIAEITAFVVVFLEKEISRSVSRP